MAKIKRFKKIKKTRLLSIILIAATLILSLSAFSAIFLQKVETLGVGSFTRGTISTETGRYQSSDTTLYTKNAIPAIGLEVTPDFEGKVDYQIFWYNMDDKFIGYSAVYADNEPFVSRSVPMDAWYARIVLIPRQSALELEEDEEFKISFFEIEKYASDVKISYLKEQDKEVHDLYSNAQVISSVSASNPYINVNTLKYLSENGGAFIIADATLDVTVGAKCKLSVSADNSEAGKHLLFVDMRKISQIYLENFEEFTVHYFEYSQDTSEFYSIENSYNGVASNSSVNLDAIKNSAFAVIVIEGEAYKNIDVFNYMPLVVGQIN